MKSKGQECFSCVANICTEREAYQNHICPYLYRGCQEKCRYYTPKGDTMTPEEYFLEHEEELTSRGYTVSDYTRGR